MNEKETTTRQVNFSALSPVIQKPALSSWCVFFVAFAAFAQESPVRQPKG